MKISQAVFGVFHHFALARELDRRGHLDTVYSTWPWARLRREGLPHSRVKTFPWIHTPETLLSRYGLLSRRLSDDLGVLNALRFDDFTAAYLAPDTDALIALAGAGLKSGRLLQQRGGVFICDRGSTHQRYQEELVSSEYRRWNVDLPVSDIRDTLREEEIYAQADAITVPSSFARTSFLECGVPAEKLHVIPYGTNLIPLGDCHACAPGISRGPGAFNVLFVGSLSLRKGVPYLLQAFARFKHPRKHLILAGPMEECLRRTLPNQPLEGVELSGPLTAASLRERMQQSHVLVLPSIEDGFGLVLAEAMACGCPVIASVNTGGADLFEHGKEGFLVPIRDAAAIAERLEQLADDPVLHGRMSAAALARVQNLGGWTDYGDRWNNLLERLVRRG